MPTGAGILLVTVAALAGPAATAGWRRSRNDPGRAREVLDETGAYLRADEHVHAAAASLDADVRLRPVLRNAVERKRLFRWERRRVNVEVAYDMELPPCRTDVFARNRIVFGRMKDRWAGRGYRIVRWVPREPFTVLAVADPRDGFTVVLRQGVLGNLAISAGSPWVRPTGG